MELWSSAHLATLLPATLVMVCVGILLRFLLKDQSEEVRRIPFQTFAVILFLLEIGKQVSSLVAGYDLYHLPFHYCSLLIFAPLVMAFYKGKHKELVDSVVTAICYAVGMLTLIYPCLIYSADNIRHYFSTFFDFHTVTFHNIAVLLCVLIPALNLNPTSHKHTVKGVIVVMVVFSVVSAVMAQLLQTNYANMYQCNIPPLESVRLSLQGSLGYGLTQILYVTIVSVLQVLFTLLAHYFYKLIRFLTTKRSHT